MKYDCADEMMPVSSCSVLGFNALRHQRCTTVSFSDKGNQIRGWSSLCGWSWTDLPETFVTVLSFILHIRNEHHHYELVFISNLPTHAGVTLCACEGL